MWQIDGFTLGNGPDFPKATSSIEHVHKKWDSLALRLFLTVAFEVSNTVFVVRLCFPQPHLVIYK